jgi:hypothetical protein
VCYGGPPNRPTAPRPDGRIPNHGAVGCDDCDTVRAVAFSSALYVVAGRQEGDQAHDEVWMAIEELTCALDDAGCIYTATKGGNLGMLDGRRRKKGRIRRTCPP